MGVEAHNERKKDGHKMYGRSQKWIQNDLPKRKKSGIEIEW